MRPIEATTRGIDLRRLVAPAGGLASLLLVLLMLCSPALAQKKSKQTVDPNAGLPKRVNFDLSKIVWPNPPAIARVKFVRQFTGEKIDFGTPGQKPAKPKQTWMDRLAGTKLEQDKVLDQPFQLQRTYGLAFDPRGNVYVADQAVGAIFVFKPNEDSPKKLEMIRHGHEAHFGEINGLAIDDNDRLFVSDDKLHKVIVISPGPERKEEASVGAGLLDRPGGIAIDHDNRFLYVVDTSNDVVDVFDADTYKFLRKIGTPGKNHTLTDPGDFSLPTHVAVDHEGNVYVTDTLNNRVEIFDADGNFLSMFGKSGDGPADFSRPKGIAVDADGHIWVADEVQSRVKVFNTEGRLLIYLGQPGNWPGQFSALYDIAVDHKNHSVVTSEQFPGRVQMFRYVTDAEAAAEKARRDGQDGQPGTAPSKPNSSPSQSTPPAAQQNDSAQFKAQGLVTP
jgi:DNA-binding beta-propeller fold protein YncE